MGEPAAAAAVPEGKDSGRAVRGEGGKEEAAGGEGAPMTEAMVEAVFGDAERHLAAAKAGVGEARWQG